MSNVRDRAASYQTLEAFNVDSRTYPAMVIANMYKREQELAKADEAGLIISTLDLEDHSTVVSCWRCNEPTPYEVLDIDGCCPDCSGE